MCSIFKPRYIIHCEKSSFLKQLKMSNTCSGVERIIFTSEMEQNASIKPHKVEILK